MINRRRSPAGRAPPTAGRPVRAGPLHLSGGPGCRARSAGVRARGSRWGEVEMISRRRLLQVALGALALGVPACGRPPVPFEPLGSDAPLRSPEVVASQGGRLSVTLVAAAVARVAGRTRVPSGSTVRRPVPPCGSARGRAGGPARQPPRPGHEPAHARAARLAGGQQRQPVPARRAGRDLRLPLRGAGRPPARHGLVPPAPPRSRRRPAVRRSRGRVARGRRARPRRGGGPDTAGHRHHPRRRGRCGGPDPDGTDDGP